MSLKERLDQEAARSRVFQSGYWSRPFQTEVQKHREAEESVERMKRNAGVSVAGLGDSLNAPGEVSQQARAEHWYEHGHQRLQDRASAAFELGDHRGGARARRRSG